MREREREMLEKLINKDPFSSQGEVLFSGKQL